jgi:hypothetical protein
MRSTPPAVEVTLASGRREQQVVAAAHGMALALVGAWLALHSGVVPPLPAAAATAVLGSWLGLWVLRPMRGSLRWDGQCWWQLDQAGAAKPLRRLELMMDLGGWVLLRARAGQGPRRLLPGRWCGISRQDAGSSWHSLRVALHQGMAGVPAVLAAPSDRTPG